MKSQTHLPHNRVSSGLRPQSAVLIASSLAIILALAACSKQEESNTAGQQVDAAIAKTEQAAAQAKVKAEDAMENAGAALKRATENAESSAKSAAAKMEATLDDVSITTAVSSAIGKEGDLSVLKINVDTKDGVVTLNGSAPSEAGRETASRIAKGVQGVISVNNKLIVSSN